jgi:hypothetical protein
MLHAVFSADVNSFFSTGTTAFIAKGGIVTSAAGVPPASPPAASLVGWR